MNILTQHRSTEDLIALIKQQQARIASLVWNDELCMHSQVGIRDAISHLPEGHHIVVMCDINRLKSLNNITGNHIQTNRYLRDGLRVRRGEIAGQLFGDEFLFVLSAGSDAAAFCARITRQLAEQPLSSMERTALDLLDGPSARLSATFAWTETDNVSAAIATLSAEVLTQKAARDRKRV